MRLKRKKEKEVEVTKAAAPALSTDPADAKRELTNIRPREVSLVDSAANGRKFLIVKNKDSVKQDAKLFKGEEGEGESEVENKPKVEEPKVEDKTPVEGEEAPKGDPAPADAGDSEPDPAGDVEIQKGAFFAQATEMLSNVPVAKAMAMEQKEMFFAMSDALMQFAFGMDMIQSDLMAFALSDGKTGFMGEEVIKALRDSLGENPEPKKLTALIQKRGKKMKKARLDKLKGVMDSLGSLIKELEDDTTIEKGGAVMTTKNKETPKTDAEVKKTEAETKVEETKTEEVKKEEAAKPLTAADLDSAIEKAVEKHVKPLQEKINKMEGAPASSSSQEAESTEEVNKGKDKAVNKSLWSGVIR